MKILILNYTGYRSNWGSQATSRGLTQFIRSALPDEWTAQIDILPYPPTHLLDHWQSRWSGDRILDIYLNPTPDRTQLSTLERLCQARFGPLLDRVRQADIVFFQGEGALGHGREFRRLQLFGPLVLAKHLYGKITISINQSITFGTPNAMRALMSIFGALDLNFVRELESLDKCQGIGWPPFEFIPDAAFFYRPLQPLAGHVSARPYFCITGSADLKSYDLSAFASGIRAIAKDMDLHPVFLFSRKSDSAVARAYKSLGELDFTTISSSEYPDVDQIIPLLAGSVVVIGGRYHTSISALSQNVPVILTASNSHKSRGLVRMFGEGDVRLVENPTPETLAVAMQTVMKDRDSLKARLAEKLQSLTTISQMASDQLRTFLLGRTAHLQETGRAYEPDAALQPPHGMLSLLRTLSRSRNLRHFDRPRILTSDD